MPRLAVALFIVLPVCAMACRANYRDWQTPGCHIDKADLTILQFSDTHVGIPTDGAWLKAHLQIAVENYRPDILVHTGDVTLNGRSDEWLIFQAAVRDLKPAPEIVWGNHDRPLKESEFKKAGLTHFLDSTHYRMIFIDTAWDGAFQGSYTSVPESEFAALQKAADTDKFILLFAHHPLAKDAPHFRLKNADAVLALFARKKLVGAFTGHFHGAYLAPEGNVLFAGVAPLTLQRLNHTLSQSKGYRIIELQNGCMRTKHVEVD